MSVFSIRARQAHRLGTIPFVDRHLLPSAKRSQYELWREEFFEYDQFLRHRAKARHASRGTEGNTASSVDSVMCEGAATSMRGAGVIAAFLGGFAAGEGCFVHSGEPPVFRFSIGLGAADRSTCELFRRFVGKGHVRWYPRRKPHYDDEVVFVIASLRDHLDVTIPFMDQHLAASYKRDQYLVWRSQLLEYWEHRAKRPRPCTIDGCEEPRRAHGLCRQHLWQLRQQ